MLKVWGRRNSVNVKKVLWALEEIGLPYELTEAGMAYGIVNEPWFRAMNPNGLVPVIHDKDLVLWESNAIVRYLATRYSPGGLAPSDPAAFARADRWTDWTVTTFFHPYRDIFWNLVRLPPEKRDPDALAKGIERCNSMAHMVEAELARQPFLSGDQLGIGDIVFGSLAYAYMELPIERPDLPHLQAWYKGLRTRPGFEKAVATPLS